MTVLVSGVLLTLKKEGRKQVLLLYMFSVVTKATHFVFDPRQTYAIQKGTRKILILPVSREVESFSFKPEHLI